jgi:hypothetical protein
MKTITFTYTKSDGNSTKRVLMPYTEPSKFYEGVDVSELSDNAQVEFATRMDEAYDKYLSEMTRIKAEFDLVHSYRRFAPDKMTEIVVEHL